MSRPAESPGGLVNTEPAFAPPGWFSRRQRTISAISASRRGRGRRPRARARPTPRPGAGRPTSGGSRGRGRRPARHPSSPRRGRRRGPSSSVAAMSEPWPPAFMRTAPPTEPGTPTAHSKPVSPAAACAGRRPGRLAGAAGRATRRCRRRRSSAKPLAEHDGQAGEAARRRRAGSSPCRRRATGDARLGHDRRGQREPAARRRRPSTNSAAGPPTRYVVSGPSGDVALGARRRARQRGREPPPRGRVMTAPRLAGRARRAARRAGW